MFVGDRDRLLGLGEDDRWSATFRLTSPSESTPPWPSSNGVFRVLHDLCPVNRLCVDLVNGLINERESI